MNGWIKISSTKNVTENVLGFAQPWKTPNGNSSTLTKSATPPPWCYTPGCGPAPRPLPFGLTWHFQGIIARLHQKQEDNFLLFVIRYDEALELAKHAPQHNSPSAKKAWLDKVDEACRFAKAAGMDEKNLSLLRTELLGAFYRFKSNPRMPLRNHDSYRDWHLLAAHYGMKGAAAHFLTLTNEAS